MNDSKGSAVIEGGQGPQSRLAGVKVVPDGCRECQQPLEDPCEHAFIGAATVSLQVELALQGVIHGFDELAQRLQEPAVSPGLLVGTGRTDERGAMIGKEGLELGAGVALVPHDLLPGTTGEQVGVDLEHVSRHLSLVGLGVGKGEGDGQARGGADQMQAQSPEVAGVARTVPIAGESSNIGAPGGWSGPPALHWGGVNHPESSKHRSVSAARIRIRAYSW